MNSTEPKMNPELIKEYAQKKYDREVDRVEWDGLGCNYNIYFVAPVAIVTMEELMYDKWPDDKKKPSMLDKLRTWLRL